VLTLYGKQQGGVATCGSVGVVVRLVLWVLVFTTVLEFVFFIITQGAVCRGSCQHSCHLGR
jgi:hypothetical protein